MNQRRRNPFWVPLLFGAMGIFRCIGNPRLATVRAVDIVQLIATGACLGVALAMMAMFFRQRREQSG